MENYRNNTKFISIRFGYLKTCSKSCGTKLQLSIHNYMIGRKLSKETIEKIVSKNTGRKYSKEKVKEMRKNRDVEKDKNNAKTMQINMIKRKKNILENKISRSEIDQKIIGHYLERIDNDKSVEFKKF